MEYRHVGTSDLKCSAITFGAWAIGGWMWGGADRREAVEAIRAAYEEGMTSIDTAPAYGQGLSEEIVAEALAGIPRDRVQLLTKFGLRWDLKQGEFFFSSRDNTGQPFDMYKLASRESIIHECEQSLQRLKTDYIDLYQIHWPDASTPISETMEALERLKEQGKIRTAGVCNYSRAQMEEAGKTIRLESDQVPYSMLLRDIETELVPYCLNQQQSVIAYSPLQRGLLTGKIKPGHLFNEGDTRAGNRFYTDENIRRVNEFLEELRPLANDKNASLSQLVIAWTIRQPGISLALVGARNATQARENAQAARLNMSDADLQFINEKLNSLRLLMPSAGT